MPASFIPQRIKRAKGSVPPSRRKLILPKPGHICARCCRQNVSDLAIWLEAEMMSPADRSRLGHECVALSQVR